MYRRCHTDLKTVERVLSKNEGGEEESKNTGNGAIIKEQVILNTLFDALKFNIFGGTSIELRLAYISWIK